MSTKTIRLFLVSIFFLLLLSVQTANAAFDLVPCGKGDDPNQACTICHLIVGVSVIIDWLKNILITVAVVGIFVSGIMYIISAGDPGMITKTKNLLKSSLIGFIVVMMSWFFVNTVLWIFSARGDLGIGKENWYTFNCSTETYTSIINRTTPSSPSSGTSSGTGKVSEGYKKACPNTESQTPIDFENAKNDSNIKTDSNCNKYNFNNNSGVDIKILKAIAQIESTCGRKKSESGAHACGLMQIKSDTASSLAGRNVTCNELINNDSLSIELAAKYIAKNISGNCVKGKLENIFAGYNSGYACNNLTSDGKKPALYPSSDCPGAKAFECCKDPGELTETINYVWNGIGLYNKL